MKIELKEHQIDITQLKTGVYFININLDGQNVKTSKLIIAR